MSEKEKYHNYYHCEDCDECWEDRCDCICDETCHHCDKAISPYKSEDINEPKKIVITVRGGVAAVIEKPDNVTVEIRDYDIQEEGVSDSFKKDSDGNIYQEMFWE